MAGGLELLWAGVLLLSGVFGLPLGMPPGPEDPVMTQVAPEKCLVYATWTGVAKTDLDANPTEKWLAQPNVSLVIPKLRAAAVDFVRTYIKDNTDPILETAEELIVEVVETSLSRPTAVFLNEPSIEVKGQGKKLDEVEVLGGLIVATGDRTKLVTAKFKELLNRVTNAGLSARESQPNPIRVVEINGQPAIEFPRIFDRASIFVAIREGYFLVGLGDGSIEQMDRNMKTPGPNWLVESRKRLKVDRFASAGFVNARAGFELMNVIGGRWWELNIRSGFSQLFEGVESAAFVSGLDEQGFLSRAEFKTEKGKQALFEFFDGDPLPESFFEELPSHSLLGMTTRLSKDEILKFAKRTLGRSAGQAWWDQTTSGFLEITGVKLEEELLAALGDNASVYYDLSLGAIDRGWVVAIRIEDEMSFPAVLDQMNKSLAKWCEDKDGIGKQPSYQFRKTKNGQVSICELKGTSNWEKFAWCLKGDQWYFARTGDEIAKHLRGQPRADGYLKDPVVRSMYDFGEGKGFSAPLAMGHLNWNKLNETVGFLVEGILGQKGQIYPGFDFSWTDLPLRAEIFNETIPTRVAMYKTEEGFQLLHRQTIPGASPPVTAAALSSLYYSLRLNYYSTKLKLERIGEAHLAFEKKHGSFVAAYSNSQFSDKPQLSWRVHLLPFLGHQELYDQFKLDEAWDSPHNMELTKKMPPVFEHPTLKLKAGQTVFMVPSRRNIIIETPTLLVDAIPLGTKRIDVVDGLGETAMVLEAGRTHAVFWSQPDDWKGTGQDIRLGLHGNGMLKEFGVLFGDGSVRLLPLGGWTGKKLSSLVGVDDGEQLDVRPTFFIK